MNGFLLVESGRLRYLWRDHDEVLERGALIYLPRGSHHQAFAEALPLYYYRVNFLPTDAEGETVVFAEEPRIVTRSAGETLFRICAAMASPSFADGGDYRTLGLFGEFMSGVVRLAGSPARSRVSPAVDWLDAHYTENVSAAFLAGLCDLSEPHFFRLFRAETGMTPVGYRNNLRIRRAERLLAEEDFTVTETAELVGFDTVFYFSRVYKQYTGHSPRGR